VSPAAGLYRKVFSWTGRIQSKSGYSYSNRE
jgi:hypothetical protein